jgi:hypothetical protein
LAEFGSAKFLVHTRGAVDAVESLAQVVERGRLLVGSMMRASTSWKKTSSPSAASFEPQYLVGMLKGVQQAAHPPGRDR